MYLHFYWALFNISIFWSVSRLFTLTVLRMYGAFRHRCSPVDPRCWQAQARVHLSSKQLTAYALRKSLFHICCHLFSCLGFDRSAASQRCLQAFSFSRSSALLARFVQVFYLLLRMVETPTTRTMTAPAEETDSCGDINEGPTFPGNLSDHFSSAVFSTTP